jgi:hypothetical protein
MVSKEEVEKELANFTGTENYYKAGLSNLKLTDGMQYLREALNCYWLTTIVESVQHLPDIAKNSEFILWAIKVNPDKSFVVTARYDTGTKPLYEQKGEYTDFLFEEYEFYQCGEVLLLKSEY